MPQLLLPYFPEETSYINRYLGFIKKEGYVYYFNGQMPIFHHAEDDINSFKLFACQLYLNGNATQSEIASAFGIRSQAVKRWVKRYREEGADAFYSPQATRTSTVLTKQKLEEIQGYLDEGMSLSDVSDLSKVKKGTIAKAVQNGKLRKKKR